MQRRYKRREDLRELAAVLILKVLQKQEKQKKQTMENYEIKYKLGSGNFAKVYLAIDNSSGKEVALKLITKKEIKSASTFRRIHAEMANMKKMSAHPNVVSLYNTFETDKYFGIAMEYVSGGELFDLVQKQEGMSESKAKEVFKQILLGVQHCHKHGIAHRDLKLENILIDSEGRPKIADFGFSKNISPQPLTSSSVGSPLYSSPEIIQGKPYKGSECDVWSLGVILYTMLTATMPFDDSNMGQFLVNVDNGRYPEPLGVSDIVQDLISKILEPNSKARYTLDEILSHPWFTGVRKSSPLLKAKKRRNAVCYESREDVRSMLLSINECNCSCHREDYMRGHRDSVISRHCEDCEDILANDPEVMMKRHVRLSRNSSISSGYGSEMGSYQQLPITSPYGSQINLLGFDVSPYATRRASVPRKSSASTIRASTCSTLNYQHRCSVPAKPARECVSSDEEDIVFA